MPNYGNTEEVTSSPLPDLTSHQAIQSVPTAQEPAQISIAPEAAPEELIGFEGKGTAGLIPEDKQNRAYKFDMAFGSNSPGLEEIMTRLDDGREDLLRDNLVSADKVKRIEVTKRLAIDNLEAGNLMEMPDLGPAMAQAAYNDPLPASIALETGFVQSANDYIRAATQNEDIAAYAEENPMGYGDVTDPFEVSAIKKEVVNTLYEEQQALMKQEGWGEWGWNITKQALELPSWTNLILDSTKNQDTASWLPGSNIAERIDYLRNLPPEQMKIELKATIDRLNSNNTQDGREFLEAMQQYSYSDAIFRNMFALSVIPGGAAVKSGARVLKGTKNIGKEVAEGILRTEPKSAARAAESIAREASGTPADQAAKAAESVNEAISVPGARPEEVMASSGLVEEASRVVVKSQLARDAMAADALGKEAPETLKQQMSDMLAKTVSYANPRLYITGNESLAAARADGLLDMTRRTMKLIQATSDVARVGRLPQQAEDKALDLAEKAYRNYSREVEQSLMDVRRIASEQTPINAAFLEVTHGDLEKLPFDHRGTAYNAAIAYGFKPGTFKVAQVGEQFVIKTYKAVDESLNQVIDDTMPLLNQPRNNTWTYPKSLLSSKTSVSKFQAEQRATASHGASAFEAHLREFFQPLENLAGALNGRARANLDKVMHLNRITERVPGDPSTRGLFYRNRSELDNAYMQVAGRHATDLEAEVYTAFVQASDLDWVYRSWNEFKRKSIKGIEELTISRKGPEGEFVEIPFEGKVLDDHSFMDLRHDIDIIHVTPEGDAVRYNLAKITDKERDRLKAMLGDGLAKAMKTWDPRSSQVGKILGSDTPVSHVITSRLEKRNPLNLNKQVNYKPGFHNEYKANWFMKQAKVLQGRFEGDVTAMAGMSYKQMKRVAATWEKARQLLRSGNTAAFNKFVRDNLDMTPDRFKSFFDEHLNIDTPFVVVKRGTRSVDSGQLLENGKTFVGHHGEVNYDLDRWHNPSSEFGDPFTATRDPLVFEGQNMGTEDNPLWGVKEAAQYSPMFVQTSSMGKLIKSTMYNDLQLTTASNYVEAFKGKLMYDGAEVSAAKLRANPIFYLEHATIDWKNNPKAALQAWQLRTHAKNLLGQPSMIAKHIDYFKQKMIDATYNVAGEKGLDYIPEALIPTITDPFQYARAVAFHSKLGMFNITQYFVQASAINNMVLMSPLHGLKSFAPSTLMARLELTADKKIIEHFADIAHQVAPGWNKKMFIESKNWMDKFAFDRVGGEYSFRSTTGDPQIYRGTTGKVFLDKGPVFFNAGERTVRLTSWNTAYAEWATKNPGKVGQMTRRDAQWVLDRAQVFSSNMTRDSNSFWQQGLAGNFTQFWSYNIRMGELMLGKQLSAAERSRLIFGNMLLYGFTPAAGLTATLQTGDVGFLQNSLNPWAEDLRVYAAKKGYDMDNDLAGKIYDGMISTGLHALTGAHVGVGNRYGLSPVQAFDTMKENFQDHNALYAFVISSMGPSGNIMSDMIDAAMPTARDLRDFITGDNVPKEILEEDIINAFREVTGVSNGYKIYSILRGLNWRSQAGNLSIKNDAELNKVKEIIKAVTGVSDVTDLDAFNMLEDSKMIDADRNAVRAEAKRYVAQYYDLVSRGDPLGAQVFFNKARILVSGEHMSTASKMEILFPGDQAMTPSSERLFRDWFGKLTPEEQLNVDNIRKQREAQ